MTKLRFGIRTIATATVAVAIFCTGYMLGYQRGENSRIDALHSAIQSITGNGEWVQLGGPETMGGGISILTTDGCEYYELDASGNRVAHAEPGFAKVPGGPIRDVAIEDDPFR